VERGNEDTGKQGGETAEKEEVERRKVHFGNSATGLRRLVRRSLRSAAV